MAKLLLFRAFSLVCLITLLVCETFYRPIPEYNLTERFAWTLTDDARFPGKTLTEVEKVQEERKKTLIDYCHQRDTKDLLPSGTEGRQIPSHYFRNIIVSDDQQLLYCYVPKVACSNWKRVLLVLNGDAADPWRISTADVHNRTLGLFRYLNEYNPDEIVHRLNTYNKFLFVRHPFERLISAYRNKFIDSYNLTFFKDLYGRYIIKHYRENPDKESLKTGEGVSFTEFVRFVLNSDPETTDRHWRRFDDLCHPCLIYYDYIGKFENLLSDSSNLLKLLQVDDKVQFPSNKSSHYNVPTAVLAKQYFKDVPSNLKTKLYNLYRHDFEMFGYSTEEY